MLSHVPVLQQAGAPCDVEMGCVMLHMELLRDLPTEELVELIEDLDEAQQNNVLEALEPVDRTAVQQALNYPEYTAGRIGNSGANYFGGFLVHFRRSAGHFENSDLLVKGSAKARPKHGVQIWGSA